MQIAKVYCDLCGRKVHSRKVDSHHSYPHQKLIVQTMGKGVYGGTVVYEIKHGVVCLDCHEEIAKVITEKIDDSEIRNKPRGGLP